MRAAGGKLAPLVGTAARGAKLHPQVIHGEPILGRTPEPVLTRGGLEAREQRMVTPREIVPT